MSLFGRLSAFFRPEFPMSQAEKDQKALDAGQCPDCGSHEMIGGPRGGAAQNFACGACLSEFNLLVFAGHIGMIDRMGKLTPQRAELYGIEIIEHA